MPISEIDESRAALGVGSDLLGGAGRTAAGRATDEIPEALGAGLGIAGLGPVPDPGALFGAGLAADSAAAGAFFSGGGLGATGRTFGDETAVDEPLSLPFVSLFFSANKVAFEIIFSVSKTPSP